MNVMGRAIKGAGVFGAGQVLSQGMAFCRNVILARVLSPSDIGVAALFAMTLSFMEMMSDFSMGMLIIQSEQGDDEELQATAQLTNFMRGLGIAAALLCAAPWLAWLFSAPQAEAGFRWLAVVPIIKNLAHNDLWRLQRKMDYFPAAVSEAGAQVVALIAVWPIARWCGDYSAVLWIIVIQMLALTALTHLTCRRPYQWRWNRVHAKRIYAFGWPLLINGLLMFGIIQGDRLVIGIANHLFARSAYTLHDLGLYFVAFSLTTLPVAIPAKTCGAILLPILSRIRTDQARFEEMAGLTMQLYSVIAAALSLPLIVLGGWICRVVYGADYGGLGAIVGWLAAMQALRLLRAAQTLLAISRGDTKTSLIGSLIRVTGLIATLAVVAMNWDLSWMAAAGCAAELVTTLAIIWRVNRVHRIPAMKMAVPVASLVVTLAAAAIGLLAVPSSPPLAGLIGAIVFITFFTAVLCLAPGLRQIVARGFAMIEQRLSPRSEGVAG